MRQHVRTGHAALARSISCRHCSGQTYSDSDNLVPLELETPFRSGLHVDVGRTVLFGRIVIRGHGRQRSDVRVGSVSCITPQRVCREISYKMQLCLGSALTRLKFRPGSCSHSSVMPIDVAQGAPLISGPCFIVLVPFGPTLGAPTPASSACVILGTMSTLSTKRLSRSYSSSSCRR